MAILEELASTEESFIKKVVLPVVVNEHCQLFGISTPEDEYNHFSKYLEMRDEHGRPYWNIINAGQACQRCRDEGKAAECLHVQSQPPWKDPRKLEDMKAFLTDDEYKREMLGIVMSTRYFLYKRTWIRNLTQSADDPYTFKRPIDVAWTGVDPGQGASDYVIASMAFEDGRCPVSFTV